MPNPLESKHIAPLYRAITELDKLVPKGCASFSYDNGVQIYSESFAMPLVDSRADELIALLGGADELEQAHTLLESHTLESKHCVLSALALLAWKLKGWRKGPFLLQSPSATLHIDSEWQSYMKWDLLAPFVALNGARVADVGCNNGFYMLAMCAGKRDLALRDQSWIASATTLQTPAQDSGALARQAQTLESTFENNAAESQKVDSSKSTPPPSPSDSKICDEKTRRSRSFFSKSGLFKDHQGRALPVRNRPEQPEIADLSRRAESPQMPQMPQKIVGFDPSGLFYCQFAFINHLLDLPLRYELLGVQDLPAFTQARREKFDVIFCLGVLYHRSDVFACLRSLAQSLETGGVAIIDTLIFDINDVGVKVDSSVLSGLPLVLSVRQSYAKMSNVYLLPSLSALEGWCERCGFECVEVLAIMPTTTQEQRKTRWIDSLSLEHFLDPNDSSKTIEGYPAPKRAYIKARRK